MLSFDITDRHVRIIRGTEAHDKIKVASASTIDLEEGLIVNGHIKDIPRMATIINDELKRKKMADKEAVISISSNLVIFKELHIPKAKGTQLLSMVQNQMQHTMGIADDYSISYTIAGEVEEDGVQALKVLATACPFEVVDCFRKVFSMLGIGLRSVAVACNTITRIILTDPKMKAKMPMLLVQIDPNFVSLNLYENNQLTFSRFASIDPVDYDNSPDYIYEAVNENIFRMFQFQKQRNGDNPIQNVVFYGDTTEYIRLTNALEQMDITTSLLGVPNNIGGYENFEFQAYANAIGAMFRNNKESERINLLEVDAAVGRSAAGASFAASVGVAALVSIALVAGVTVFFNITKSQYQADTAEIQAWLDSAETAQRLAAVDAMQEKVNKVTSFRDGVQNAINLYEAHPVLDTQVVSDIRANYEGTSAEILSMNISNGFINVIASVDDNTEPAAIAAKFVEQDIFDNITYTGFNFAGDEAVDVYEFQLTAQMREIPEEETAEETAEEVE
ncbi:MAG: pilus assembly protein PilM [Oscillospiraceae bacterium]|nr:pilus assembly protein PilM [Oscillospiraceae bacterium]